jgi:hypothetical protein
MLWPTASYLCPDDRLGLGRDQQHRGGPFPSFIIKENPYLIGTPKSASVYSETAFLRKKTGLLNPLQSSTTNRLPHP